MIGARFRKHLAFTLLELLIVIAIISILAGILFPVIAQAQVAAKRASSISNLKQITLGSMMYANDFDDALPLFANGNALEVGWSGSSVQTWVGTTQPYIRSLPILIDPLMGDPHHIFSSGPNATVANQNAYPDYGVNYVFLAPWMKDPSTGKCTTSGSVVASGASHPSNTIFYITTYEPIEDASNHPTGGYSDFGDWMVTAPGALRLLANSLNQCVSGGMDWVLHPQGFNGGQPFTAEASQRYNGGGVTAMLDGHARYLKAAEEAAGTNWTTSTYPDTVITNPATYMWSYDDAVASGNRS